MSKALNQERLMTVLVGPHVSEKSTTVSDKHNQIVFKVRRDSTKKEISQVGSSFNTPKMITSAGTRTNTI